jgi:hypothetical protein
MTDFSHSTQLHQWIYTPQLLQQCRKRANRLAREYLCSDPSSPNPPVFDFARGFNNASDDAMEEGPAENPSGNDFLSPEEEGRLVDFYAAKLPSLIGPLAQVPRLRREIKVSATAALLYRRFYLSNSVMLYGGICVFGVESRRRNVSGKLPMECIGNSRFKGLQEHCSPIFEPRFNILKKGPNS